MTDAGSEAPARSGARRGQARGEIEGPLKIQLEHARWRHFGWMLFGLLAGGSLIWKLGAVGQVLGVILLAVGAWAGYHFARTILFEPGRIIIEGDSLTLPAGLCRGPARTFPLAQLHHAFFLRRAVPWTRTGPLLIIEVGPERFAYPRDWFGTESDQRRVAAVLNRYLGRLPS